MNGNRVNVCVCVPKHSMCIVETAVIPLGLKL
jgi:hypothetical protein